MPPRPRRSLGTEIAALLRRVRGRVDEIAGLPHDLSPVDTLDAMWIYYKIVRGSALWAKRIAERHGIPHNPRGLHTTLRRGECHVPRTKCEWMRRCQTRRCHRLPRGSPCGESQLEQLECQASGLQRALRALPVAPRGGDTAAFHRRLLSRLRLLLFEAMYHWQGFLTPGTKGYNPSARLRPREVSA